MNNFKSRLTQIKTTISGRVQRLVSTMTAVRTPDISLNKAKESKIVLHKEKLTISGNPFGEKGIQKTVETIMKPLDRFRDR